MVKTKLIKLYLRLYLNWNLNNYVYEIILIKTVCRTFINEWIIKTILPKYIILKYYVLVQYFQIEKKMQILFKSKLLLLFILYYYINYQYGIMLYTNLYVQNNVKY